MFRFLETVQKLKAKYGTAWGEITLNMQLACTHKPF